MSIEACRNYDVARERAITALGEIASSNAALSVLAASTIQLLDTARVVSIGRDRVLRLPQDEVSYVVVPFEEQHEGPGAVLFDFWTHIGPFPVSLSRAHGATVQLNRTLPGSTEVTTIPMTFIPDYLSRHPPMHEATSAHEAEHGHQTHEGLLASASLLHLTRAERMSYVVEDAVLEASLGSSYIRAKARLIDRWRQGGAQKPPVRPRYDVVTSRDAGWGFEMSAAEAVAISAVVGPSGLTEAANPTEAALYHQRGFIAEQILPIS